MHKDENTRRSRPSRSSLSVVVLYRFSRQRLRTRHDVTLLPPSSLSLFPPLLSLSLPAPLLEICERARGHQKELPLRDQLDPPAAAIAAVQ